MYIIQSFQTKQKTWSRPFPSTLHRFKKTSCKKIMKGIIENDAKQGTRTLSKRNETSSIIKPQEEHLGAAKGTEDAAHLICTCIS
jgi:hypothetical protein